MKSKTMGILAMLCSMIGCNAQKDEFRSLSVEEYAKAIEDTMVVRLDVRTAEEFSAGHISKAINIDVQQGDFAEKAAKKLPKDKTIAVNCRSGKRSKKAAAILAKQGFQVIELDAGFNDWVNAGMPVSK